MEYTASKIWELYEKGIDYLNKKGIIAGTNQAWDFYLGDQWKGLKSGNVEMPMYNFIKPVTTRLSTTVFSNRLVVTYTDLEGRSELQPFYNMLQRKYLEDWEQAKEDRLAFRTVKEAFITGDGLQFFGHGDDASKVQRLDNTSVLYGDESEPDIQKQPYIIIHQRETVKSVRRQAKANGVPEIELDRIIADDDTKEVIGNKTEVDTKESGKLTTLIFFTRNEQGIVCTMRCTKSLVYQEFKPIMGGASKIDEAIGRQPRGLRLYPIVKLSWELRPNDARGVSQVRWLIPNQIELNRNLARQSMASKSFAFPHMVVLEDSVVNEDSLDTVGGKIFIRGQDVNEVNKLITYLQPPQVSNLASSLTEDLLHKSQDLMGAGDVAMGNVDELARVAASAINAVNEKAESMLDEQKANMAQFGEDLALLMAELHMVYNPERIYVEEIETDPETGIEIKVRKKLTQDIMDNMIPTVRVDITKENSFNILARDKWLDELLSNNQIGLESRVRLASEGSPIPKHEMLAELDRIKQEQQEMQMQQQMQQPPNQQAPMA